MLRWVILLLLVFLIHCQNFGKFWDSPKSEETDSTATARKRIFLHTSPPVGGNLSGFTGADSTCNASAQRPDNLVSYAALLVDGVARRACQNPNCTAASENIAWVLKPQTIYLQAAGTVQIGITNGAGILIFPLQAAFSTTSGFYFNGLNSDWTTGAICVGAGGSWSGTMSATNGTGGQAGATDPTAIQSSPVGCTSATNYLLCVEQ